MERTEEFFEYFSEYNSIGSASKVLDKADHNYFNEAANKIATLLYSINQSIEETRESYIDQYQTILARKSDMTNEERKIFIEQTAMSLHNSETFIEQLADNIKSGKMRLKGSAIDHAIGVLTCLNQSLNKSKRNFTIMKAQREQVQLKLSTIKANPPPINSTYISPSKTKYNPDLDSDDDNSSNFKIDINYQQQLEQEHDNVLNELLEFHDQLTQTERIAEEIATLTQTFNELMVEQTERIVVIRSEVEKATEDYESGTKEIKKSISKTKFQHLWMSLAILFLSFILVLKHS